MSRRGTSRVPARPPPAGDDPPRRAGPRPRPRPARRTRAAAPWRSAGPRRAAARRRRTRGRGTARRAAGAPAIATWRPWVRSTRRGAPRTASTGRRPAAARLGVGDLGVRDDDHALAGQLGPPAEVDVVAEERERRVEAAQPVPDVAADQQPGGADGQHVVAMVLLALVALAGLDLGAPAATAGHGQADLEQHVGVVPGRPAWARPRRSTANGGRRRAAGARASGSGAQSSCSSQSHSVRRGSASARCGGGRRARPGPRRRNRPHGRS